MAIRDQELPGVLLNGIKDKAWLRIVQRYFLTLMRENGTLRILLGSWDGDDDSFLAVISLGTCIY